MKAALARRMGGVGALLVVAPWGCGGMVAAKPFAYTPDTSAYAGVDAAQATQVLNALEPAGAIVAKWGGGMPAVGGPIKLNLEGTRMTAHLPFTGNGMVITPCDYVVEIPITPSAWKPQAIREWSSYQVEVPAEHHRLLYHCESLFSAQQATFTFVFNTEEKLHQFLDVCAALAPAQ